MLRARSTCYAAFVSSGQVNFYSTVCNLKHIMMSASPALSKGQNADEDDSGEGRKAQESSMSSNPSRRKDGEVVGSVESEESEDEVSETEVPKGGKKRRRGRKKKGHEAGDPPQEDESQTGGSSTKVSSKRRKKGKVENTDVKPILEIDTPPLSSETNSTSAISQQSACSSDVIPPQEVTVLTAVVGCDTPYEGPSSVQAKVSESEDECDKTVFRFKNTDPSSVMSHSEDALNEDSGGSLSKIREYSTSCEAIVEYEDEDMESQKIDEQSDSGEENKKIDVTGDLLSLNIELCTTEPSLPVVNANEGEMPIVPEVKEHPQSVESTSEPTETQDVVPEKPAFNEKDEMNKILQFVHGDSQFPEKDEMTMIKSKSKEGFGRDHEPSTSMINISGSGDIVKRSTQQIGQSENENGEETTENLNEGERTIECQEKKEYSQVDISSKEEKTSEQEQLEEQMTSVQQQSPSEQVQMTIEEENIMNEQDKMMSEQANMMSEKEKMISEQKQMTSEQEQMISEQKQMTSEQEQMTSNQQQMTSDQEQMMSEQEQMKSEKEQMTSEQEQITSEHEQIKSEQKQMKREKSLIQVDTIPKNKISAEKEIENEPFKGKETIDEGNKEIKHREVIEVVEFIQQITSTAIIDVKNPEQVEKLAHDVAIEETNTIVSEIIDQVLLNDVTKKDKKQSNTEEALAESLINSSPDPQRNVRMINSPDGKSTPCEVQKTVAEKMTNTKGHKAYDEVLCAVSPIESLSKVDAIETESKTSIHGAGILQEFIDRVLETNAKHNLAESSSHGLSQPRFASTPQNAMASDEGTDELKVIYFNSFEDKDEYESTMERKSSTLSWMKSKVKTKIIAPISRTTLPRIRSFKKPLPKENKSRVFWANIGLVKEPVESGIFAVPEPPADQRPTQSIMTDSELKEQLKPRKRKNFVRRMSEFLVKRLRRRRQAA